MTSATVRPATSGAGELETCEPRTWSSTTPVADSRVTTNGLGSTLPCPGVGEVPDWTRLTPEALQEWRARLAVILADQRGEIIN